MDLFKISNIYLLISLPFLSLFFINENQPHEQEISYNSYLTNETSVVNQCPAEVSDNREILENFLTSSEWEEGRQKTNTDHLTTSQITLLQSSGTTCDTFNNRYQEAISDTFTDGSTKYDLTYYKVGDFYFVIISRRQPEDPNLAASGVQFLDVFDENLNFVKGYFF